MRCVGIEILTCFIDEESEITKANSHPIKSSNPPSPFRTYQRLITNSLSTSEVMKSQKL
jgi:hypothetical protein